MEGTHFINLIDSPVTGSDVALCARMLRCVHFMGRCVAEYTFCEALHDAALQYFTSGCDFRVQVGGATLLEIVNA